jgi:hypothetical protein
MQSYTILGERNTGTHFLQYAIQFNFNLQYHKGTKHFFGHSDTADFPPETADQTIYFCMIRDPVEWIDSHFKRLHHIPPENNKSIDAFIKNEWYSIYEEGDKSGQEILEDRNMITKERYRNIFELRKGKNDFFLSTIQEKVKHFYLIRYEDLLHNYETILNDIAKKFQLKSKLDSWIPVPKYKGTFHALYEKKPILLSPEIQQYIKENIDVEQEQRLGYCRPAA